MAICALTSGCLNKQYVPLAATCRVFEVIKASPHDTPNTLRQIRKHNSVLRKVCLDS
jgi:hypothetical protein